MNKMFKCINCGKQSKEGDTPFTRTKYNYRIDDFGVKKRGRILKEEKNHCQKCYRELGAEIK